MANAPLTRESLHLPARQAVRFVARQRLQRVVDQAARITAAEDAAEAAISFTAELATMSGEAPAVLPDDRYAADPEAVHDLRVALRRLRSWLRAFHPYLDDTVKRGTERRLRRLAQIAGRARDLEVQSHWLRALPASTPPLALEAARALDARDVRSYGVARRKLARAVTEELPKLAARLESQLKHYVLDVDVDAPVREPSLASAMAPMLRAHRACVTEAITAITTRDQLDVVHAARIEVKRLRYLLETLDDVSRPAGVFTRAPAACSAVSPGVGVLFGPAALAPARPGRNPFDRESPRPKIRPGPVMAISSSCSPQIRLLWKWLCPKSWYWNLSPHSLGSATS